MNSDEPSFERLYYTVELSKSGDGNWLINRVRSNDDFDNMFYDSGFSLASLKSDIIEAEITKKALNEFTVSEIEAAEQSNFTVVDHPFENVLSFTAYDANSAAAYAASYALNYNSNFISYSSDCQNFASKCIWYGLGGSNIASNISNGNAPMIASGNGQWYQKGPNGSSTNSWINVDDFTTLINGSSSSRPGPQASYTNGSYKNCEKGDLLEYYDNNSSDYVHVYFVYRVTGTSGNRTSSDIYLSAHTNDYHNKSFAEVWSVNVSATKFRTIKITGWYS